MSNKKETVLGEVMELLPNARCRVAIEGKEYQCYIGGRMRVNKINVLVGDMVEVVMDDYGHLGRIVRRK